MAIDGRERSLLGNRVKAGKFEFSCHCEFTPAFGPTRPGLKLQSYCHALRGTFVIPAKAGTQPLLITCVRPGFALSRE